MEQSVAGAAPREPAHPAFDVYSLRGDFPVLAERVHGRPLVWLDNGATTQKPVAVIERLDHFYRHENSNIHRAAHELAARATDAYEDAREKTARFLHAPSSDEIVFVRGTTEAINLVAQAWGRANVGPGDEILITWLEHHANIVPWQQLCQATGARRSGSRPGPPASRTRSGSAPHSPTCSGSGWRTSPDTSTSYSPTRQLRWRAYPACS